VDVKGGNAKTSAAGDPTKASANSAATEAHVWQGVRILHLSDLHFGMIPARRGMRGRPARMEQSAHSFEDANGQSDPTVLADLLRRDMAGEPPTVVVVSGDIGWSGVAADYVPAQRFFELLRAAWPDARLVIAPGNHDLTWEQGVPDHERQTAFVDLLRTVYRREFGKHYPLLSGRRSAHASRGDIVGIVHIPRQLLVVAVNSAANLTRGDIPIYVDPQVLANVQQHIASQQVSAKALRVFVLHHHLLPFAEPNWSAVQNPRSPGEEPDDTIVANSVRLQAWLADNQFLVLLHGHKHLPHGRQDILWRFGDPPQGRRLMIVGAGSAGVQGPQRGREEPLSYNVVDARRLSEGRWDVRVSVRRVSDTQVVRTAVDYYEYRADVGPPPPRTPLVFSAERMDDCHAAIATAVRPGLKLRNFMSVVDSHTYVHPGTVRIGDEVPTQEDVRRSFLALHPEYDEQSGWSVPANVDARLQNVPARFQFQHGTRLFGTLGRAGTRFRGVPDRETLRPVVRAAESLRGSDSRAYVGLYNAEIDIAAETEPIPGLMSVQFVPDGEHLDVVATFRKLELSFWWVVNMFELSELLKWAAVRSQPRRLPRSITFFAPLAEWKRDPEATFVTTLDSAPLARLYELVAEADAGSADARTELARLLHDKSKRTNEVNLDQTGIRNLTQLLKGVLATRDVGESIGHSPFSQSLVDTLEAAAGKIETAIADRAQRDHAVQQARHNLDSAANTLLFS
jgi:predicted MPP superfamily phosphohydrolase